MSSTSRIRYATAALAFAWIVARAGGQWTILVAAAVCIFAATRFCKWLRAEWYAEWPILLCLLLNPYLFEGQLCRLNPELANSLVLPVFLWIQPMLFPLAVVGAVLCEVFFWMDRNGHTELWAEKRPRWAMWFGGVAIAVSLGSYVLSASLVTASLGALAATPAYSRGARWARMLLIVALWAIPIEFLFSMRLDPLAAIAEINH